MDSGAVVFGYDNNGNRVTRVENSLTTTYAYDDDNRRVATEPQAMRVMTAATGSSASKATPQQIPGAPL